MQRSGNDEKNLLAIFLTIAAILFYEPLTTIYPFLPPLFGLAVWKVYSSKNIFIKVLWIFYLYLYEVDHNIVGFALLITLFLSYSVSHKIAQLFYCKTCLKVVLVLLFYAIFVLLLNFLSYIFNSNYNFNWIDILYYLIIDIIIVAYAV
ncbi:hypothetical protein [Nitratiruptor sp. YY09-18]|uniref:hypothetical protein n=1 Tax=Nitratiruptor sp. YY09-18 TaxID=2724901 RepID=UPI00191530BB|nr:hypothetical protein [Nitratiruptor sp. YY09-18]BCD67999.1 hypothetical protein NitYY0918_C0908 [Nitratiruptor sp. YY09-18]